MANALAAKHWNLGVGNGQAFGACPVRSESCRGAWLSRFGGSTTRSLSAAVLWEFVAVLKPFAVLVIDALDDPYDLTATLSAAHSDRSLPLRGLRIRVGARRREWARFRRHLVRPLAQGEADHPLRSISGTTPTTQRLASF